MSFLNWPAEETLCTLRTQRRRNAVILGLIEQFSRVFPEITYELLWESRTINAQAWRLGPFRYVRVYGGLVRHQTITRPGLALMLAHETGHHHGGLPHDPAMPWMTWQGQADYWAASIAMPKVFGAKARGMTLRGARQILRLHSQLQDQFQGFEPNLSAECRYTIFRAGALKLNKPACGKRRFYQNL
jgi:hypothetical protein